MIENEYKIMLNEHEYSRISSHIEWDSICCQYNYYYDTKGMG